MESKYTNHLRRCGKELRESGFGIASGRSHYGKRNRENGSMDWRPRRPMRAALMSENLKVLQVFIASPNDLVEERRAIKEVADRLNAAFAKQVGVQIQLLGWEDRLPGYGRAQAQINEDVDKADLFVGFLWRRWGSDPGNPKYTSGFEEEFHRAMDRREKSGSPEISLFFKKVSINSS